MSWVGDAWDWYVKGENREALKPLLSLLGSLVVGIGTVTVGALVARAALRQARTATEQARTATEVAQTGNRQADIAGRRHVTDTFSKAVEQLGSEKMEVRIGGIYTLERLAGEALDSPRETDKVLYWTAMETLTAFVRERARRKASTTSASETVVRFYDTTTDWTEPATDIAAVLTVLQRRPEAGRRMELVRHWCLDLRETDLRRANMQAANLGGANLEAANLSGAYLGHANLSGAYLWGTNLDETTLSGANLSGAYLEAASLRGAFLVDTNLRRADLRRARLNSASLVNANLGGANLDDANLSFALLRGADLSSASLVDTNLRRADLSEVEELSQSQLDVACGDPPPRLPPDGRLKWEGKRPCSEQQR